MNKDVSIGDDELRIILRNFLEFLEPDRDNILRDLRQFDFLVDKVEPYTSLHCLSTGESPFDMNYCLETCPAKRIAICVDMFYRDNYFFEEVNKNGS